LPGGVPIDFLADTCVGKLKWESDKEVYLMIQFFIVPDTINFIVTIRFIKTIKKTVRINMKRHNLIISSFISSVDINNSREHHHTQYSLCGVGAPDLRFGWLDYLSFNNVNWKAVPTQDIYYIQYMP
jgi:hypothetical protein